MNLMSPVRRGQERRVQWTRCVGVLSQEGLFVGLRRASHLQMPIEIVAMIADKLCQKDQADFRLTCKTWHDAYPVQQRIVLRQTEDWEDSAREIKRLCQEAVIVVQANGISDLPQLFLNPDCDQVSLDTRPGWASQWSLQPMHFVPDKIKEV